MYSVGEKFNWLAEKRKLFSVGEEFMCCVEEKSDRRRESARVGGWYISVTVVRVRMLTLCSAPSSRGVVL